MDELADYRSGSTEPWTVAILCALIKAKEPRVILETGTYLGLTTCEIADAMPKFSIFHTIDNDDAFGCEQRLQLPEEVQFHKADALEWIKAYEGPRINFAFIDDDHSPQHVHNELTALKPKMDRDGLICVHDVHGAFQLKAVVSSHHGISLRLPLLHSAGGLGLIQL